LDALFYDLFRVEIALTALPLSAAMIVLIPPVDQPMFALF
jgi:hypothetical protein